MAITFRITEKDFKPTENLDFKIEVETGGKNYVVYTGMSTFYSYYSRRDVKVVSAVTCEIAKRGKPKILSIDPHGMMGEWDPRWEDYHGALVQIVVDELKEGSFPRGFSNLINDDERNASRKRLYNFELKREWLRCSNERDRKQWGKKWVERMHGKNGAYNLRRLKGITGFVVGYDASPGLVLDEPWEEPWTVTTAHIPKIDSGCRYRSLQELVGVAKDREYIKFLKRFGKKYSELSDPMDELLRDLGTIRESYPARRLERLEAKLRKAGKKIKMSCETDEFRYINAP